MFECLWLVSGNVMPDGQPFMSDELRPDKVHVLFWFPDKEIKFMAFKDRPNEIFPRPDVVVQEDGDYYGLGESRNSKVKGLRDFLRRIERSGMSLCFINRNQRLMVESTKR